MQDFVAWAEARQDARFTDWLRADVAAVWEQAADHRFARELAAGSIDDAVFRRYLIQDYSFIDVFCTLLGFAVGHAPSLQDRIPLAQFLGLVTSEENTYFERALAALGVEDADRVPLLPATQGFHDLLGEAAHSGSYEQITTVLVATEWLYLDWASRVADTKPARFIHAEWIELHANVGFAEFVGWLRGQLDRDGPKLDADGRARVLATFRRAIDLEKVFFDAAYG